MKNIINKFTFFVALSFVFISCGNLATSENDDSIPQGKGKICISTDLDSQSRSVLPTAIKEDTKGLTWELEGTCEVKTYSKIWNDKTSEDGVVTTAYNNMKSDNNLLLDAGTWNFTLKVKNNSGFVLFATKEVSIETGENNLSFEMKEATSSDIANGETVANGSIEFTLKFPKDVIDNVVATLYNHENSETVESATNFFIDSTTTDNYSSVKYSYQDSTGATSTLAPGYYRLHIDLRQNTGDATASSYKTINTYTCLIRVAPGLCSKGEYTLDSLAKLYTITYECNQGTFGTEPITTSYNKYTSFELPTPTLYGHTFDGWYTDASCTDAVNASTFKISSDTTLYAKWTKNYDFQLSKQDGGTVAGEYILVDGSGCVTITDNITNVSVWNYYLKSNNINFQPNSNYKITVEMKAEADSVVAIQAANADMFFTVGKEWTPCTMETGFIEKQLDSTRNAITFGIGLSQKTYFRNLVIEEISDDGLPTLVFDITTEGINQYLNSDSKAKKIIDVEKVTLADNKLGYSITINTPLSNNNLEQYVKLHLRDYAKDVGVNNVSFKVSNTGEYPFATSFMVDTASNNSMAWNNVRTEVVYNTCNIDFPNYAENDELTVDVITGSDNVYSNYPVEFTISNFKVENVSATAEPFNGKIFAIKVGSTWTQGKSVEVTIPVNGNKEFDVGMFNGWDSSQNMPSSFDDVTRFLYTDDTGDTNITDNLSYSSDPNAPTYTITNNSSSDVKVKITLDDDYKVQIKEVENQPIDLTVDSLKNYLEPNNNLYRLPTGEYRVTGNLTLSYPIYIDSYSTVKIYADDNVEITPAFTTGPMINLPMSTNSTLTLGGGNGTLTLKGTGVSIGSVISSNTSLIIEDGFKLIDCDVCAINVTYGTFTMNGGEITNISREGHIINIAGGTAIFNGGSIYNNECVDMRGTSYCIYVDTGTLNIPSNSTASIYDNYSSISAGEYDTEKGAFIYNNKGTVTILGSDLAKGTCYEEPINSGGGSGTVTGITYAGTDSTSSLPKFYITTAEGLATFRDMVNGTLLDDTLTSYTISADSSVTGIADYSITNQEAITKISGVLKADIDLSGIEEWIPIGNADFPFSGSFDGQNKTISNLTIQNATTDNQGLFGVIDGTSNTYSSEIKNLVVNGSIKSSGCNVAGIVGKAIKTNFIGCVNNASVESTYNETYNVCVGGIAGYVTNVTAEYCYNSGNITANMSAGGIIGYEASSTISSPTFDYCVNTGTIKGSSYIGGIIGYANKALSLGYCANYGTLDQLSTSTSTIGCIIGSCSSTNKTQVTECLIVGSTTATNYYAVSQNASVTSSYYDKTILSSSKGFSYNGGGSALETSQLKDGIELDNFYGYWNYENGRYPIPDLEGEISSDAWNLLVNTVSTL